MKNNMFSSKVKVFLLSLLLPLTSCTMLNPSSSSESSSSIGQTSSITSTSSTSDSENISSNENPSSEVTSTIGSEMSSEDSSELPSSWETPSEEELVEGISPTWPSSLIQSIFTSAARYSLPAFVSPLPFYYQYTVEPIPMVMLSTNIGELDGVTIYKNQLTAVNWTIYEGIIPMMGFIIAVDPTSEMMVLFAASEETIFFEICNYDEEIFKDEDIQTSPTWPSQVIADYLGTAITSVVPPFESAYEYNYILPSEMVGALVVTTRVDDEADVVSYLAMLLQSGWIYDEELEIPAYIDPDFQISLAVLYESGYFTMMINPISHGPTDPETFTSPTWPQDALDAFLTGSFLKIEIPSFSATEYSYTTYEEEIGTSMIIFSTTATTTIEDYVQAAVLAGWNVKPMHINAGNGYYAVDPEYEIFFIIENEFGVFRITMWTYHPSLESYFSDGSEQFETSEVWPSEAIEAILTTQPQEPVPSFVSSFYRYKEQGDNIGSYLLIIASGTEDDATAYQTTLQGAGYTVSSSSEFGTLAYVAFDADLSVFLYYYYAEGTVTIIVRDYDERLIGGDPTFPTSETEVWPVEYIETIFGSAFMNAVPPYNQGSMYHGFFYNDEQADIDWLIINVDVTDAEDDVSTYMSQLINLGWTVVPNHDEIAGYYSYLAYSPDQTVMLELYFSAFEMQYLAFWLLPYDQVVYDYELENYFTEKEDPNANEWPTSEIETMFPDLSHSITAYPLEEGQTLVSEIDEVNQTITITISEVTEQSLTMYMSVLCGDDFIVYINYDDGNAVGYHPSGLITIYYHYSEGNLTIEIKSYSMFEFAEYYTNQVFHTSMMFPTHIIETVFGAGLAQMVPVYVTTNPYTYLTEWYVFQPTLEIQISSDVYQFSDYYFALEDAGWTLDGIIAQGSYFAIDPTGTFKIEATINQDGLVNLVISVLPVQPV